MVADLALKYRLPTMFENKEFAEAGGLMSLGVEPRRLVPARRQPMWTRSSRAPSPGDLPMEQPTKFDLVINLKTAKALGLTIPPSVLARADEVIQ